MRRHQQLFFGVAVCAVLLGGMCAGSIATQAQVRQVEELKTSFASTVKQVSPAVVNIYTEKVVKERVSPFADDPFFNMFFPPNMLAPMKERVEKSLGSGVMVSADGTLVTNFHVVNMASEIHAVFENGRAYPASYVGGDERLDLAVLKLQLPSGSGAQALPFVQFANSDAVEVGDVVLAIGNPYGVGQSVSMGIVSAVGRSTSALGVQQSFIQTDAAINPGNSGGALVNSTGRLIGINTAIFSRTGGSQGIGFAIPANTVQSVVRQIMANGKVVRPWLGATGQNITPALADTLGLPFPQGVLLNDIVAGSPAARAGLVVGDIILSFNGQPVGNVVDLNEHIVVSQVGSNVQLKVWREGKEQTVPMVLESLPERRAEDRLQLQGGDHPFAGMVVEQLSPALNQELGLDFEAKGVVVVQPPASGLVLVDLRAGDILVSVNDRKIATLADLKQATSGRPRAWTVVYQRGGRLFKVIIR